nr:PREDICTED: serine/arginine repetitive matrix protein 3 [Anolis carolinensis]|eukprot:XP_008110905.1 PREDICTED: serine/arginine repetitive matrix protein 3 [Anolis carolinensis]
MYTQNLLREEAGRAARPPPPRRQSHSRVPSSAERKGGRRGARCLAPATPTRRRRRRPPRSVFGAERQVRRRPLRPSSFSSEREREASLLFLSRQHSRRPQGGRRASPHAQALPPFIRSFCLGLSVGSRAFALLAGPAHRPPSSSSSRRRRPRWGGAGRRQGGGAAPCWEEIKERPGLPHWLEKQTSIWSQARKSSNTCHILISRGFFEEKLSGGWMFDEPLSPSLTHPSKIQDKIKSEKLLAPSILDKEDSTCVFCL